MTSDTASRSRGRPLEASVRGFWDFVQLRQVAWSRKTSGLSNLMCSEDPVLRSAHFPNVFRELDPGTIYFHQQVPGLTLAETLFASVTYRLLNRKETFMDRGGIPRDSEAVRWIVSLEEARTRGAQIFTGRHQTNGFTRYKQAVLHLADPLVGAPDIARDIQGMDLPTAWNYLVSWVPGVSKFFAWQVLCDLIETGLNPRWSDDSWAYLGPGPQKALTMIYGNVRGNTGYIAKAQELCVMQPDIFSTVPVIFPPNFSRLSLKNIEHSLCEYYRYTWAWWKL